MRRRHLLLTISLIGLLAAPRFVVSNKPTADEKGIISHTICDGEAAELICPKGTVISIVIGNYGRFSVNVCLTDINDDDIPSNINCQNHKTKSILEKKCNGRPQCDFYVNKHTFPGDECPNTSKYLEVNYQCVVAATTTSTTTTTTTTTTDASLIEERHDDDVRHKDALSPEARKPESDVVCPATNRRGVNWQNTKAGTTSSAPCPEGASGKQLWTCSPTGHWLTEHPNSAGCESNWVATRTAYLNNEIGAEEATGIPESLRLLGSETRRPMVGGDLPKVLQLLEKTVRTIVDEPWARKNLPLANKGLIEVMNYVIRNQEIWGSWEATKRAEFASRLMLAAEKAMIASAPGMLTSAESNVIVQPAVTVEISHKIRLSSQPTDYVLFPSAALWSGQNVDNVNVPRDAMLRLGEDETQVFFSSFDNLGAHMTPRDVVVADGVRKRRVVTRIVGASLIVNGREQRVDGLRQPVRITFHHKQAAVRHLDSPVCVWWNHHQLEWSPIGCRLHAHNATMTACECDHLTHFAVLMDVNGHELDATDEMLLTTITNVGCIVSIVCLLLTFFAYLIFSRNGGDRVFIHQNLCLSLAIAEITFLAGISRTEDSVQCSLIAVALMYMFLSALTWMLLEGYHIHRMLTEVFASEPRRLTYLLVGYISPAVITIAAYAYNSDGFGTADHCWLTTRHHFIWFFAGPACLVFTVNSAVLVKTLCTVYKHTRGGYLPCRHDVDSGRPIRSWVKGAMALAALLGVTWLLGLLWLDGPHTLPVAYAFTITNSLQGLFIFLFHVVFADKMRKDVAHWMYRRGCGSGSADSSPKNARHGLQRDLMSPGLNSSTGSEFLYNTNSDKYLTSSDTTSRLPYNGMMTRGGAAYHHHPHYDHQGGGQYDYATIAYGDMLPGHRIAAPPAYQRLAAAEARYGSQHQLYQGWHHRPPPEFSPPPPPPPQVPNQRLYGTGSSSSRRPPSSKMSDDSAYSDGGSSSMLTTEVTPQGQTVLRIDLNKPNMYCQEL